MNTLQRLLSGLLFVLICSGGMMQQAHADQSNWMRNMKSLLENRTLKQIVIPGSHDAAMSVTEYCASFASECNTKTQNKSVYDQLLAGSRFFDLRPLKFDGEFVTGHYDHMTLPWYVFPPQYLLLAPFVTKDVTLGCNGENLAGVLRDVKVFLDNHPGELVILNFSHYFDRDGSGIMPTFTTQTKEALSGMVKSILGDHLVKLDDNENLTEKGNMRVLTFKDILKKGQAIAVFDTSYAYDRKNGILRSEGTTDHLGSPDDDLRVYGHYANKNIVDDMISDQFTKLSNQAHHGDKLFLLSWTLTQQPNQQIGCYFNLADDILELAQHVNGYLSGNLLSSVLSSESNLSALAEHSLC